MGTRGDKVFAVREGGLGRAGEVLTLAQGLRQPNGVALRDGDLYVAAVDKVYNLPKIEDNLDAPPAPVLITDQLPGDSHHGWRYAAFGPDGLLYIAVGAPCNVCEAPDPFSSIIRMDDQGGYEVFARGIRNSVGLDWRPGSGVLWFTNNDRDWMGDDEPPDSLHRAPRPGLDFGFPYCHAGVPDPELNQDRGCARFAPAARKLPAHVAALGMRFYTGEMFPPAFRGAVFIAEHGSWNRSKPIGYRVSLVRLEGDKAVDYQPFATGWLGGASAWGRPVDVLVDRTGALLVSDDRAGAIYRITYEKP
ncbi:PQQ-dependent sugar dehydrogenase [Desulfoferula mesophila]|uniref:Sorbosone dehydrogenase n=1 Tax=Desulfoferula mesophila TaxID=3058419 RepID=A0AAU9EF79_9BACT|nr:sorbosone dehydrogenase [Desulfoferula mesophilus]